MANFNGFTPLSGQGPLQPGWFQTPSGQKVFGTFDPLGGAVKTLDPSTGQPTGQWTMANGQTGSSNFVGGHSAGEILKDTALLYGGTLAAGAGLGALGGNAAPAAVGSNYASDAAAATEAQALSGSTATTAGGFNWGKFLPQAFSTGLQSFLGARAADSAANQQKQAGQAAAQSFSPFAQGGLDAYNLALGMFGIAPVSATPGSIAARPTVPTPPPGLYNLALGSSTAPQPYSLASFNPPAAPPQGQPMPPQPYSLSTFSTGGR